ncbi:MAG: hypothetical protein N2C14_11350, partial [Planctomycetales bacterium]
MYFWRDFMGSMPPTTNSDMSTLEQLGTIFKREFLGIIGTGLYFIVLPPVMAMTVFRKFFVKMGFIRFMVMTNLLLFMILLPLKMALRWTVNLKYFIYIPEYFFNF